ncbi:cell division protein FtsA [Hyphococcus flavus]|uniref:Cell division protein FtsA n=1 Tax=Hyphococcus flavus TaxID=1866326 RepID=A0AAF0CBA2_9PROT|nr:cell division protein FtsA [Hyphococcus flavus]WDI30400.1 cell division protein FtsA [Hyphococcus flavus]
MAHLRSIKNRKRDETAIAALDIGASKVACFVARISQEPGFAPQAEVIGVGCYGAPLRSRATPDDVETGVRNAVEAAERMAGQQVDRVIVSVPGKHLRARRIGVDMEIVGGIVAQEDVDDTLAEGAKIATPPDCAPLHAMPTNFRVDGEDGFADPLGFSGSTLSTEMFSVSAKQSYLDNMADIIERCDLDASAFVAAPFAAAEAVLLEDEKELGVVLIDIGAVSTGFAVYDNSALIACGGVPAGGGHITRDIAQIFGAPLAHAERMKTLYGSALAGPGDEHRFVDFPQLGIADETARASRADVAEVILPRLEEIFELVAEQLPDDPMQRSGLRRVVLTGGGSLLVGAREVSERVLAMKGRLGRPIAIPGSPEAAGAPAFSVCAGLVQHYANLGRDSENTLGVLHQSLQAGNQSSVFGGVEAWLRAKF